jgi:hypothetical protein
VAWAAWGLCASLALASGAALAHGEADDALPPEPGVRLSAAEVQRAVDGWRRANPWAQAHGQALEGAYLRAMRHKGREFAAGRIVYLFDGQTLWYSLPSGRVLCYPNAKFDDEGNVTYTQAAWKPAADAKEWPRARLWKGLACENILKLRRMMSYAQLWLNLTMSYCMSTMKSLWSATRQKLKKLKRVLNW